MSSSPDFCPTGIEKATVLTVPAKGTLRLNGEDKLWYVSDGETLTGFKEFKDALEYCRLLERYR